MARRVPKSTAARKEGGPDLVGLGMHLRELRLARGLTQDLLAEAAGVSPDSIRRIEHGGFSPSLEIVWRIVSGMGLEMSTMFAAFEAGRRDLSRECFDALSKLSDGERAQLLRILFVVVAPEHSCVES